MIRRTFFQSLGAALLPRPLLADAEPAQAIGLTLAETAPPTPIENPEWLREWREIPKLEVFAKDLLEHENPHERAIATVILDQIQSGKPFTFRYYGGSEPGSVRAVLPTLLFFPDFCPFRMGYEDPTELPDPSEIPMYLLGWCQTRQAARTFRLDRMEWVCTGTLG